MRKFTYKLMKRFAILALIGLIFSFLFPFYTAGGFRLNQTAKTEKNEENLSDGLDNMPIIQQNSLVQSSNPYYPKLKRWIVITAYSSTPDQTDSSPFITASGTTVRDGIIAANFLRFGTWVKIPALYGDKIFIVEDRLHPKNGHKIDIWFPTRESALNFGVKYTEIEII